MSDHVLQPTNAEKICKNYDRCGKAGLGYQIMQLGHDKHLHVFAYSDLINSQWN